MKVLFDIGNSRIKWALAEADSLGAVSSISHGADCVAELLAALPGSVDAAWAVNVAGAALESRLSEGLQQQFGIQLQLVQTQSRFGEVINGYESFAQLGADRWAAIVGAWYLYKERVCVVDAGTAVTIDMVEADGRHRGGVILPGLNLMAAALNRDTADIESFAKNSTGEVAADGWFGKDTRSAVQRGARFALRSAIRQAATAAAGEAPPRVLLTGGDADSMLPLDDLDVELRPGLVLEGVRVLSEGDHA